MDAIRANPVVDAARAMGARIDSGPGWISARCGRFPAAGLTLDCSTSRAARRWQRWHVAEGHQPPPNRKWRVKEPIAAPQWPPNCASGRPVRRPIFSRSPRHDLARLIDRHYDDHADGLSWPNSMAPASLTGAAAASTIALRRPTFNDYFETLFSVVRRRLFIPVSRRTGQPHRQGTWRVRWRRTLLPHYRLRRAVRATALAAVNAGVAAETGGARRLAKSLALRFEGEQ